MFKSANRALALVAGVFAAQLAPSTGITPSAWAAANLVVPDGPRASERWSLDLTPYLQEPLDKFGPDDPCNKIRVRKSAQTGFTTLAIAAVGHTAADDPCRIMLVQPTSDALSDFVGEKLAPAIEGTPALKKIIKKQTGRSGEGSTTYSKKFPKGSLTLAIASSTADLRSKTVKKVIRDEASDYPPDLDGQGSPHSMITARYTAFLASGDWKDLGISTPTIKGDCWISDEFEAGDQRYWHVVCPHCGGKFYFRFGPEFVHNDAYPYNARYFPPCCGAEISATQKFALVKNAARDGGGWIATASAPGRTPTYHFDALSSPFVPWDAIAEAWVEAQKDPAKLKGFYNLVLGLAFEMKGDAPDWKRLLERVDRSYVRRTIPARGLMLTAAADVQLRGIYVEVVAWAPNRESWVVDAQMLEGDTTDANGGAFLKLAEVYDREYPDAFGGHRSVDAFGVDSGFRSHVVYDFVRRRHNAFALKGVDGWHKPALGTPGLVDVDLGGKKIAQGCAVWPVGGWSLKGHLYADLRREGRAAGHEADPSGYCHFGAFLDDVYFRQITAEYLAETRVRHRVHKRWAVRGKEANHFLDCRVYNMALADHLGLSRMTETEWRSLARERAAQLADKPDLFAPRPVAVAAAAASAPVGGAPAPTEAAVGDDVDQAIEQAAAERPRWIAARPDWLKR